MRHPKTNNFTKLRSAVEHYLRDIHKRRCQWIGVLEVKNWVKLYKRDGGGGQNPVKKATSFMDST